MKDIRLELDTDDVDSKYAKRAMREIIRRVNAGNVKEQSKAFQCRVKAEKADLDSKRDKLQSFIKGDVYRTLGEVEQSRLNLQLDAMTAYSNILGERIAAFAP